MPRTREQLQKAVVDTEAWLDQLDPETIASPESSAEDLRAIGEALHAVAASDLRLADEVTKARANGRTWTQIAAVLGVSKQAARERFGEPARRYAASPSHHGVSIVHRPPDARGGRSGVLRRSGARLKRPRTGDRFGELDERRQAT
jgi:hypothetical protein